MEHIGSTKYKQVPRRALGPIDRQNTLCQLCYVIFTYDPRQAQAYGGKSCQSMLSSAGEEDVDNEKKTKSHHRIHARKSGKDEVAFCIMRCRHINMEPSCRVVRGAVRAFQG
jgi:hypothetical protein